MKKLVISVAIACATAIANAGCYTWGLSGGEDCDHSGNYIVNEAGGIADVPFTAMLFIGTIGQTLNSDGTSYALDFSQATYVTQTSKPTGYTIGSFSPSQESAAVDGKVQPFSILLLDTGAGITDYEKYEGTYAIASGSGVVKQDLETTLDYTEFTYLASITDSDYRTAAPGSSEPVPEPTSGLLLILGVAGMALRRRRM